MKKSIVRRIIALVTAQLLFLIFIFCVFVYFSYAETREEIIQSSDNFLQVYGKEIKDRLDKMEKMLNSIVYQNINLAKLESKDESERFYASLALSNQIKDLTAWDDSAQMLVIAEGEYDICLSAEGDGVSFQEGEAIREFVLEMSRKGRKKARWYFTSIEGKSYIYRIYMRGTRAEAAFLSMERLRHFWDNTDFGNQAFTITDGDGTVWTSVGFLNDPKLLSQEGKNLEEPQFLKRQMEIVEGQVCLESFVKAYDVLGSIRYSAVIIILLILGSIVFALLVIRYIRRELLHPMQHLTSVMDEISDGSYELRFQGGYESREFIRLAETFNRLMDEIVGLRIQSYEKQLELKDTELKCVRLTLRPHFFLNAMTTISSLSMQNKNVEIDAYVKSLSKNIRYMFRSGLHTVPVREEISHVENYFEMQELKYPGSVFYFVEMAKECEEWRIPQLLIHTLIENEYKYAVSPGKTLSILIRVSLAHFQNETMLSVEIEDDGQGYPENVLKEMGEYHDKYPEEGTRIGLWSIRKILYLMYERTDLFQMSNVEPHGCRNLLLIPEKAKHEMKEETVQNKIG